MRILAPIAVIATLVGCGNPCQDLCKELVDYAEECGYTAPETEPGACMDEWARGNTTPEDRDTCRQNIDGLRDEWSCDDVARFVGAE